MLAPLVVMYFLGMPQAYLAGKIYAEKYHPGGKESDLETLLPFLCALFPPIAAVLAATTIFQTETTQ